MNIEQKQKELDLTNYWDAPIYNFHVSFFGDETIIEYEDNQKKYWRVTFLLCGKVEYTTDALWKNWRDYDVKSLKKTQLGYSAQNFTLLQYAQNKNFVECRIDLGITDITIVCRDIQIEHLDLKDAHFFWQDNDVLQINCSKNQRSSYPKHLSIVKHYVKNGMNSKFINHVSVGILAGRVNRVGSKIFNCKTNLQLDMDLYTGVYI